MGWSCNRDAGLTLEAITVLCIESTGLQNVYMVGSKKYMLEVGREQGDGAICATVYKYDDNDRVKRSGSLRIEGDGKVSRGPAIFKKLEVLFFEVNGHRERWRGREVTQANIDAEVIDWRKQWEPDGCNSHIGVSDKSRFPTAVVKDRDGNILGEYKTPMFLVE